MFDDGDLMETVRELPTELDALGEWVTPVALAAERTLPVLSALAPLLPGGALRRGTVVALPRSPGATSLAMALAAQPSIDGSWVAVVGSTTIGMAAASDLGVVLDRVLVVEPESDDRWETVIAALIDAVDLVLVAGNHRVAPRLARRMTTRLREQGTVIFDLVGCWPEAAEVTLETRIDHWCGIGSGHGALEARKVVVRSVARRDRMAERRAELWLPDPRGSVATVAESPRDESPRDESPKEKYSGSDFDDGRADRCNRSEADITSGDEDEATVIPFRRVG